MQNEPPIEELQATEAEGTASFTSSCVNLMKTMLGAGILAMPSVFVTVGYGTGLLLLLLAMLLSLLGQYLLVISCSSFLDRRASIRECCHEIHPLSSIAFDVAVSLKSLGVTTSYLIIIGDSVSNLFKDSPAHAFFGRIFWISISLIFVVPLSLKRNIDSLKQTSIVGILICTYVCGISIALFLAKSEHVDIGEPFISSSILPLTAAFTVFIFGFTCHQNVFHVYNESVNKNQMVKAVAISVALSALIYITFGLCSFFTFGSGCKSNIFDNYDQSLPSNIARVLFTVLAAFTIPLQMFPLKRSIFDIMHSLEITRFQNEQKAETIITITSIVVAYFIAIVNRDLRRVLSQIGKFAGIPVCYYLPSFIYLYSNSIPKNNLLVGACIFLCLIGIFIQSVPS